LLPPPALGKELGKDCLKKASKCSKIPAHGINASVPFSSVVSKRCEEFRRGKKPQEKRFMASELKDSNPVGEDVGTPESLLRQFRGWMKIARPGLFGSFRQNIGSFAAAIIMALACLVLLAACTNIASMLSARLTDRKAELAIRMAIGAGRFRIARQLLTECVLTCRRTSGNVMASLTLESLSQRQFHPDVPVQFAVNADARVFAFTFLVSLLTRTIRNFAGFTHVEVGSEPESSRSSSADSWCTLDYGSFEV
jgi:hypothetical protein